MGSPTSACRVLPPPPRRDAGVEIRPILPEEHEAEAALVHAANLAGPYGPELRGNEDWLAVERATAARDAAGRVLVAVPAGRARAMADPRPDHRPEPLGAATLLRGGGPFAKISEEGEAELRLVAVRPDAQGRGVGAALTRAGLELALRWGAGVLRLDTGLRNPARSLYERLGFARTPSLDARAAGDYGASLSYEYPLQGEAGMRVREIREGEARGVSALVLDAYRGDYPQLGARYLTEIAAVADRAETHLVWVAEDLATGELLGTVTTPRPGGMMTGLALPGELEVRLLGVARSARGRGVGERLMRHCLRLARIRGEHRVVLNTSAEMPAARRLYERLGFEPMPERERRVVPPDRPPVTVLAYGRAV